MPINGAAIKDIYLFPGNGIGCIKVTYYQYCPGTEMTDCGIIEDGWRWMRMMRSVKKSAAQNGRCV